MQIIVTDFAKRHFEEGPGTTITSHSPEEFAQIATESGETTFAPDGERIHWINSNNGFCFYMIMQNFTDATVGSLEITKENEQYLKSEYTKRRKKELPYLRRYLDLPEDYPIPTAKYLNLILYTREQILKEMKDYDKSSKDPFDIKEEYEATTCYGIVGIQGLSKPEVEPMTPYTMVRNALGTKWGGNGDEINWEKMAYAADYWQNHALIK